MVLQRNIGQQWWQVQAEITVHYRESCSKFGLKCAQLLTPCEMTASERLDR